MSAIQAKTHKIFLRIDPVFLRLVRYSFVGAVAALMALYNQHQFISVRMVRLFCKSGYRVCVGDGDKLSAKPMVGF